MASRLQESYAGLDAKIHERTRELTEANDKVREQAMTLEKLNEALGDRVVALDVKREEADRANAAKTRFLAAASHDLRQPLHSVGLLVGILRERMPTVELSTLVDKVQLSVQAMESLFKSLLDISKLDAGAVVPNVSEFDIGSLLRAIENSYAPQAEEKGLVLDVVASSAFVRSDPVLLERIIGNLVSNAIRYTYHGRVLVGCRRHSDALRIMVIDTGVGIAAVHLDDIFDEFFQVGNPERDRSKGLGLGLSIVKRTAELLGHTLTVRSQPGKGSIFAVEVEHVQRAYEPLPRGFSDATEGTSLEGAFVALIDDDQENRYATEALCRQWNCHVVSGTSAAEILARLADHLRPPDLIVTDYQLRDHETGLDVIARIREHAEQTIPALIVSGAASAADLELVSKSGFELLQKPVNPAQLRRAMQRLLAATDNCVTNA
jgi:signal transduction histidine kinase/CheY-like chemotaxis protein